MERVLYSRNKLEKNQQGFTLIEIMIVVVILAVLATAVLPKLLGRQDQAFVSRAKSDISTLSQAISLYKLDNYVYPSNLEALVNEPSNAKNYSKGGYISGGKVPTDPWGEAYEYRYPGSKGDEYDLWSKGKDGKQEIGNWNLDEN